MNSFLKMFGCSLLLHAVLLLCAVYYFNHRTLIGLSELDKNTLWFELLGQEGQGGERNIEPKKNSNLIVQNNKSDFESKKNVVEKILRQKSASTSKENVQTKSSEEHSNTSTLNSVKSTSSANGEGQGSGKMGVSSEEGKGAASSGTAVLAQIRRKIERAKTYPESARLRAQQGNVRLSFSISNSGTVDALRVIQGSGYKLLDAAALDTIKKAAPYPLYDGPIEITLRFNLEE